MGYSHKAEKRYPVPEEIRLMDKHCATGGNHPQPQADKAPS